MNRISRSKAMIHIMLSVALSGVLGATTCAFADPPSKPTSPTDAPAASPAAIEGASTAPRDTKGPARAPGESPTAPLALKQDMIRDRLDRFRDAVFRLQQDLSSQEPENAARLARALSRMGETGAAERVAALVNRLNKGESIQEIVASQDQTVADLEVVLAILVRREGDNDERRQQIEQLQENLKSVSNLLDRQKEVRAQTAAQARGQRLREQLEQAAGRASDLLRQQQDISRATADANRQSSGMNDDQRFDQARSQADLAKQTRELAEQLDALLGKATADVAPTPPDESTPNAGGAAPPQPSASDQPAASEARENPSSGLAPAQSNPGAPQSPLGAPPSSQESGAPSPSPQQPTGAETGQQASQDVQNASQRMSDAASSLHAHEDADAEQQQKQAEDNLRRAIHQLEEAARKTQDQSPEETARAQHALAEEAQRLSEGMSPPSEKGNPDAEDAQSPSKSGTSQPGADPVQKAEREMWDSAQKLEREQREQSLPSQDEAVKNLEEAKRQMEDALTQKRKEEREEILRDLESRFHDMYVKQKRIAEETKSLDAVGPANFARAEQLQAAQLADGESKLAEAADTCLHILEEEGTTIVFPRILEQVGVDLKLVAQRLAALQTGALTQSMQQEIVEALEQLIEAVQRMQRENEQQQDQQQDGSPDDMNSPLLPTSAELKLLRAAQARVHERTTIIDQARATESGAADSLRKTIESTAARQKECADIAAQLRKRVEGE